MPNNSLLSQMINRIVNETSACMLIKTLRYISDTPIKILYRAGTKCLPPDLIDRNSIHFARETLPVTLSIKFLSPSVFGEQRVV